MRKLVALVVLSMLGTGLAALPAAAAKPPLVCGPDGTVQVETSVKLQGDLTCGEVDVEFVNPGTTTLDLNGHTLTGVIWIDANRDFGNMVVKVMDGTVNGNIQYATATVIARVAVHGSVLRPHFQFTGDLEMRHSSVDGLVYSDGVVSMTHSAINAGVFIDDTNRGLSVSIAHNRIRGGVSLLLGGGGEFPGDVWGDITDNDITHASGAGIDFVNEATNVGTFLIADNRLHDNTGDGVNISGTESIAVPYAGGPVTLRGNVARNNGGHGFNVPWVDNGGGNGIVDGGGNVAHKNATAPPCIGIAC